MGTDDNDGDAQGASIRRKLGSPYHFMKRDFDLFRKILLFVENAPSGFAPTIVLDGYSGAEIGYHAHLLIEAGLARGVDVTNLGSTAPESLITNLTWAGHEFAELARDQSRWEQAMSLLRAEGRGVTFDELKRLLSSPPPARDAPTKARQFERDVAAIYRALGSTVQQDVVLAGNQIDVFVQEKTSSGALVRTAIECKAYSKPIGLEIINQFASLVSLLKERKLIDRGAIVTTEGFTKQAREAAKDLIDLLEIADLQQRVKGMASELKAATLEVDEDVRRKASNPVKEQPRIFVLMPFASEFLDVYVLGIREVAEKLGFTVDRADDIEHNGNILDVVQQKIRQADIVIADMSTRNANVFYEIGFAHAVNRPTVLLCRNTDTVPFDLQSINYIKYAGIVDLRERLEKRLKALREERADGDPIG